MREASSKDFFSDIKVRKKAMENTLLPYVNDTIFTRDMNIQNVVMVKSILRCFELVSGIKVNFHKSIFGGLQGS